MVDIPTIYGIYGDDWGMVYYSYTHITLWQPNIAAEKSPSFMRKLTISMAMFND